MKKLRMSKQQVESKDSFSCSHLAVPANRDYGLYLLFATLILLSLMSPLTMCLAATTNQISQFGITWTFDKDYEYGQFANGDFWVVGPVNIIGINPPSTEIDGRTMNGSMVNPSPRNGGVQGYDSSSITGGYDPSYNVALDRGPTNPLVLQPDSSLVSTISIPEPNSTPQLKTVAVLTILDDPAPEGSFRPPYSGTDKNIQFNKNQLDYSKLASLSRPANTPRLKQESGDAQAASVERMFERVWLDHRPNWGSRYLHPSENMPDYGVTLTEQIGVAALMLNLDFTNAEKETLLIRFVQLGIDLYGIVQDGGKDNWIANGGHQSGRKLPILFAGLVLNDSGMKSIGNKSGDYLYSNDYGPGNPPPDYIHFQEDDQTFYVKDDDIYSQPYTLYALSSNYKAGHVKVTYDSNVVEGVGTSWSGLSPSTYRQFGVVNDVEAYNPEGHGYNIKSIDSDTQLTLASPYRGETNTSGNAQYIIGYGVYYGHGGESWTIEYVEYTYENLGLPEWGMRHATTPRNDGLDWESSYRAGQMWEGTVLAVHIMSLKTLWNHNALFDYVDRYVEIRKQTLTERQRQWSPLSSFVEPTMWDTYRADYGPVWTMSPRLTISAINGTVTKTPDKPAYDLGEIVTLEAFPNLGYEFVGWSGQLLDKGNPGKILMHANQTVTANFAIVNQPPVANAGPDQVLIDIDKNGSEQVTLDGSASKDPDGTIVSYVWSEGGLEIANGRKPTVTLPTGTHSIELTVTDNGGLTDTDTVTIKVLKEGEEFGGLPTGCYNNVINPLRGEEAIVVVELKERGSIKIDLYDMKGKKIRELADEEKNAGTYPYYWDGKNDSGNVVGSGLYFVHIQAGDYKKTKKIVVVK